MGSYHPNLPTSTDLTLVLSDLSKNFLCEDSASEVRLSRLSARGGVGRFRNVSKIETDGKSKTDKHCWIGIVVRHRVQGCLAHRVVWRMFS